MPTRTLLAALALSATAALPAHAAPAWACTLSPLTVRMDCHDRNDPRRSTTLTLATLPAEPDWLELLADAALCRDDRRCSVSVSVAPAPRERTK